MSGFPLKNPTDASKFRQQYLATLALQAKNDDINLQANKIYKKTGETPTQMTDTRTTVEKEADVQRLKIEIRKELSPIADGVQTEEIVNELLPAELVFLANNITEIIKILQPKYKLGILASVFIPFLRKYMKKQTDTQGVEYGLQQETGDQILMSVRQIEQLVSPAVLQQLRQEIKDDADNLNRGLYRSINRRIDDLEALVPTKEFITAISQIQDSITKATIQQLVSQTLEDLPDAENVSRLLSKLRVASTRGDVARINQIGSEIETLIAVKPQTISQMKGIYQTLQQALPNVRITNPFETQQTPPQTAPQTGALSLQAPIQLTTLPQPLTKAYDIAEIVKAEKIHKPTDTILGEGLTKEQLFDNYIDPIKKAFGTGITNALLGIKGGRNSTEQKMKEAIVILNYLIEPVIFNNDSSQYTTGNYIQMGVAQLISPRASLLSPQAQQSVGKPVAKQAGGAQAPPSPPPVITTAKKPKAKKTKTTIQLQPQSPPPPPATGRGMKGRGLSRKSKAITIETEGGIKPQDKYVSLGRYFINKNKLNNDVISIRTKTGHSAKIPVRRVSSNLSSVVKNILGGGLPSTDDLEKLTDDEKNYLHKLSKQSNIIDKLSIPTPNKKQLDKDINQFEIMKGQIMAGNDNTEYIKKFKLLIVKLINQDILPSNQGKEILIDLASLGY
jgi:hypothetical protein